MYFSLDNPFCYQDANDLKAMQGGITPPDSPGVGELWLDTTGGNNKIKKYNGSAWELVIPFVQKGRQTFAYAGTTVVFGTAYSSAPVVIATAETRDDNVSVSSITTTGFTGSMEDIHDIGAPESMANWISIGE